MRRVVSTCVVGVIVASILGACTSRYRLVGSWQNDAYSGRRVHNVLVIRPEGREGRQILERQLAGEFESRGVQAASAALVWGEQVTLTADRLRSVAQRSNIDAVCTVRRVAYETIYSPELLQAHAGPPRDARNLYDALEYGQASEDRRGYATVTEAYVLTGNLYDAVTGDLMWTATVRTTQPVSGADTAGALGRLLVQSLDRAGFLR